MGNHCGTCYDEAYEREDLHAIVEESSVPHLCLK